MMRFGWFSTGRDKAAIDLFDIVEKAIKKAELQAGLAFVFSNREHGESRDSDLFFRRVETSGVPLVCLSHTKFGQGWRQRRDETLAWRAAYEKEVMARIGPFRPDLCVLAGYMLIVGGEMCRRYPMINLHPAAPGGPVGSWEEVMWKLIEARASSTGAMMHLVTTELDRGPLVAYCTLSLKGPAFDELWKAVEGKAIEEAKGLEAGKRLFDLIRRRELAMEFPLILSTLKALSEGKVQVKDGRVLDLSGKPIQGLDLTEEVETTLRGTR